MLNFTFEHFLLLMKTRALSVNWYGLLTSFFMHDESNKSRFVANPQGAYYQLISWSEAYNLRNLHTWNVIITCKTGTVTQNKTNLLGRIVWQEMVNVYTGNGDILWTHFCGVAWPPNAPSVNTYVEHQPTVIDHTCNIGRFPRRWSIISLWSYAPSHCWQG